MSRLIHYSTSYLSEVRSCRQDPRRNIGKPNGLWVSVEGEDDWANWCKDNDFGCLDYATEVVLRQSANVLRLSSACDLDEFHAKHSYVAHRYGVDLGNRTDIDWTAIAKSYDGIIIAPYVWSRRLNFDKSGCVSDWYYGWDCSSGCIWNASAVDRLNPLPQPSTAQAA